MVGYRSGQPGQTVNLLAYAFLGSNPSPTTINFGWEEVNSVIQMRMKKGESVERALKRLKKVMDKEGLLKQLRNNRYYEKPCVKTRLKSARARIRSRSRRAMREMG